MWAMKMEQKDCATTIYLATHLVHLTTMPDLFGHDESEESHDCVHLVEQEICLRSSNFMGTSDSTWNLAVGDIHAKCW